MIYIGKWNLVRITSEREVKEHRCGGLTDEACGLTGLSLGDVGREVCMANVRLCRMRGDVDTAETGVLR
jgi:hypothetical protein